MLFSFARARIQQLESEAAEHASRVARLEYRAASDVRAEQESCIAKISAAQTRHQASAERTLNGKHTLLSTGRERLILSKCPR